MAACVRNPVRSPGFSSIPAASTNGTEPYAKAPLTNATFLVTRSGNHRTTVPRQVA